ncbi:hypothetical protein CQW23_08274 [Capsicum baccatum]|uniref:Pectinesterase inhibitor domain-containing protein n=1 Tax=Capsicum baccatum TaxID=33114 RepID=A0A2G2X8G6_CAPBA|nr:hypothetical protein CQW23_08274 [Capsicum baccatum]
MAVSYSSVSFLIVSLLSIFFTLTSVKADLIDSVCSKSSDKVVCFSALRDDPRSKGANPEGLAAIAIELSQKKATSVYNLVSALLKQTTDPKLKMRYSSCLESFNDAINNLGKLPGYLKSKDYYNLSTHASAAIRAPTTCDNNFLEAPAEVLQLRDASHNLRGLIDVILLLCIANVNVNVNVNYYIGGIPYKSDIPRAIWNPTLTRRESLQPEYAARVGVPESDTPHDT